MENVKFIILFATIVTLHARTCPPDWNPSPCFCDVDITPGTIDTVMCDDTSKINSTADLKKIFQYTKNTTVFIGNLYIHRANLEYLNDTTVFGNFKFKEITIRTTKIKWISNDFFKGQTFLQLLDIRNNKLEQFDFEVVHSLNLTHLSVRENLLYDIPPITFSRDAGYKMRHIGLSRNKIRIIRKNTFVELPHLQQIVLYGNEITTIEEHAFYLLGRSEPLEVYLHWNNLTSDGIHKNAFPAGLKLRTLGLSRNHLTSLPMHIFEPILEVMADIEGSSLYVSENPFVCNVSFAWLVRKPEAFKNIVKGLICPNGKTLNELTMDDL